MSVAVKWLIYIAIGAAVILFTTWMWRRSDAKHELNRKTASYSRELFNYAVSHGHSRRDVSDDRGNYTLYYCRTMKNNVVYEVNAYIYGPESRKLELCRYELPKGEYSEMEIVLGGLFWWRDTYGGLDVVSDEYFSDDWLRGEPDRYLKYYKEDGKPFDRRARDIGKDAGVMVQSEPDKKHFLEIMEETLAALSADKH